MTALFFYFPHPAYPHFGNQPSIGSHVLTFNQDAIVRVPAIASVDAPLIFAGKGTSDELLELGH